MRKKDIICLSGCSEGWKKFFKQDVFVWTCRTSYKASFESIGELFVSCDFCCSIDSSDGREEPVILDDLSTMRRSFLHQRLSKLSYRTDMDEVIILWRLCKTEAGGCVFTWNFLKLSEKWCVRWAGGYCPGNKWLHGLYIPGNCSLYCWWWIQLWLCCQQISGW